jgi:hypothetical protein
MVFGFRFALFVVGREEVQSKGFQRFLIAVFYRTGPCPVLSNRNELVWSRRIENNALCPLVRAELGQGWLHLQLYHANGTQLHIPNLAQSP